MLRHLLIFHVLLISLSISPGIASEISVSERTNSICYQPQVHDPSRQPSLRDTTLHFCNPGGGTLPPIGGGDSNDSFERLQINGAFDKPVILVEGYDPRNDFQPTDYLYRMPWELRRYFRNTGRDIVFVEFNNPGASIETNADELRAAIQAINSQKRGNHPNAVFGYSMGGLVSRIALSQMESDGANHDTSLYISYDTPHRGANIPIEIMQRINQYFRTIRGYASLVGLRNEVEEFRETLWSDAARDMTIWRGNYRRFDQIGYPSQLTRVAYSNGSGNGLRQGLRNNETTINYRIELASGLARTWNHNVGPRRLNHNQCSYPCNPVEFDFIDNAPGSTLQLFDALHFTLNSFDPIDGVDVDIYSYNSNVDHNFIPTLSALDIRNYPLNRPIGSEMVRRSPFDRIHYLSRNQPHNVFASAHTNSMISSFRRWHRRGASIPSRASKVQPLEEVGLAGLERVGNSYALEIEHSSRADRYEIFARGSRNSYFRKNPIKTIRRSRFTNLSVTSTKELAVRACRGDECTYPTSGAMVMP